MGYFCINHLYFLEAFELGDKFEPKPEDFFKWFKRFKMGVDILDYIIHD